MNHHDLERLHILEEHLAERTRTITTLQTRLAASRANRHQERLAEVIDAQERLTILEQTPPAKNAREDRRRRKTASIRPLTFAEHDVQRLKGGWFFRLLMVLILSHLLPRFVRNRTTQIKELRRHILKDWQDQIAQCRREKFQLEQMLAEKRETDPQRNARQQIATLEREVRQLTLQRDTLKQTLHMDRFVSCFKEELDNIPHTVFFPSE